MRIISGTKKGKTLKPPAGEEIRPTSDRVKEAVFSIIQFDVQGGMVLDLFSGSGQLGIEALSRGAEKCVFIDNNENSIKLTKQNVEAAGFADKAEILKRNACEYVKNAGKFDIVFVDPPYKSGLYEKILPLLSDVVSENGKVVCEHDITVTLEDSYGRLTKTKTYKYGQTAITLFKENVT